MRKFLLLLLFACFLATDLFAQGKVDDKLRALLQTATSPVQVVVTFEGDGPPTPGQVSLLRNLGISKGLMMRSLPIAGVLATAAQVEALAQNPEVLSLYANDKLTYYNNDATAITGVQKARTHQAFQNNNNGLPLSGKGIGVVVNDSGVDGTHEDLKFGKNLKQNVMGTTNLNAYIDLLPVTYVEGIPNTDTNSGHGTHCAGTIGGTGAMSAGKYEGVAPGVTLIGYGSGAALYILDAIGGFDYAITNQFEYGIRVISNSWGSRGKFNPNNPVNVASKKAFERNIISVFAAGNSGPGANTHNPYAQAPWVISVGAGDKTGKLANFSSRGEKESSSFYMKGETWTLENRPTVVAPGVDIVSTRALAPVSSLSADKDAAKISPAHLPYYTHMSGTSMATPHVAGIVALMLEAKSTLRPLEVKAILEKTATNIPSRESWEVGAGYVNAFAALDQVYSPQAPYGSTLNMTRQFNSSALTQPSTVDFSIFYSPDDPAGNERTFKVEEGTTGLEARIDATGLLYLTGNTATISLIDPNGREYRAGIPVLFALYYDRTVAVASPIPGIWKVRISGLRGIAIPEQINGTLTQHKVHSTSNLQDIAGHPAEAAIKLAVATRLVDGMKDGFKPEDPLKRIQLADYLMMGQGVRQSLPADATLFGDISSPQMLLTQAVTAKGAAIRDREYRFDGVIKPLAKGEFGPTKNVDRANLAYSLVQALGLQEFALDRNGKPVTINVDGEDIPVDDASQIPAGLEGYVSIALELGLINAYYSLTQGPYDLKPVLHARFSPLKDVTRAEFAVIVTRTFLRWQDASQPAARKEMAATTTQEGDFVYPNPFASQSTIHYSLAKPAYVSLEVYDQMGRKISTLVSEKQAAGQHQVNFDGQKLANGIYLYKLRTGDQVSTKRMVIQH